MNTYRYMNGLLYWIFRLHSNTSRMSLWLIPHILSKFIGSPWSLHSSRSSSHLRWLPHAQALAGTSWPSWLWLLTRYTSGWHLTHAPCTWHLPSSLHSWGTYLLLLGLHWLPAGMHLLHLRREEWNVILQRSHNTMTPTPLPPEQKISIIFPPVNNTAMLPNYLG